MPLEPLGRPVMASIGGNSDLGSSERASIETTATEALVGQVLGGTYRILELLDEGGMGRLYRAEHVRLRRPIAVKVLASHLAHDPGALVRFNREAEIISQLNHPHIIHILDFDQTEQGAPYIVMELLEGESLGKRLDRERMLPIAEVAGIVAQIATALQVAHQKGIVHRDLKPDNVFLLSMEDGEIFVKLLDFGISKSTHAAAKVTREFDVLGTPDYMAPEQAISTAKADHRADQFALACMAYEMFTGRMPFMAASVPELLHKVVHEPPPAPTDYAPGLPVALDAVLLRGMAKQPEERYPSIGEFAIALGQAVGLAVQLGGTNTSASPNANTVSEHPWGTASLPRRSPSGDSKTPSGDLSAIARAFERSLPVPEATTSIRPQEGARTISSKAPTVDASGSARPDANGGASAQRMPHRPVLRSSTPGESPSTRGSRPPPSAQTGGSRPPSAGSGGSRPPPAQSVGGSRPPPALTSHTTSAPETLRSSATDMRSLAELESALQEVRRAVAHGEPQKAAALARRVVHLARDCDEKPARHCLVEATALLEPLLLSQVGGIHRLVTLLNARVSSQGEWTPAHFFLLSRIEQPITVEELLDVSPLTRPETLGFIADLSSQGIVRVE